MEWSWRQILAAVLLGWLLPRIMAGVGLSQPVPEATRPADTQPPVVTTTPEMKKVYLPVETAGGILTMMELEEYVLGVVLAEMPASFESEALKAQAVVARTYALQRYRLGDRHTANAVCTDNGCCQAYMTRESYLQNSGTAADLEKVASAVADTCGMVLTYGGQLAESTYFSCSGGRTEDAVAVWGNDYPYLQAVDSPGEEQASGYRTTVYFSAWEFASCLGRQLQGTPESWLGKATYTDGGGVQTVYIGGLQYTGIEIRRLLKLNSTAFTFAADANGITVTTRGRGHRVGMSQYGADAMAATGKNFEAILAHYYPGTVIDNYGDLG